jgi:hypothetical protein
VVVAEVPAQPEVQEQILLADRAVQVLLHIHLCYKLLGKVSMFWVHFLLPAAVDQVEPVMVEVKDLVVQAVVVMVKRQGREPQGQQILVVVVAEPD